MVVEPGGSSTTDIGAAYAGVISSSFESDLDTRNNRDFGSALTGFVFDGLSVGI